MLFSDYRIPLKPRRAPRGVLGNPSFYGAIMGQIHTETRHFYLAAPYGAGYFIKGNRPDLSIVPSASQPAHHIWRASKSDRPTTHLILSSYHTFQQASSTGFILAPHGQSVHLLDYAENARVTRSGWQIALIEAQPGDVFATCTKQDGVLQCYIVGHKEVAKVTPAKLADSYAACLDRLDHKQINYTTANLRGLWYDILNPHTPSRYVL